MLFILLKRKSTWVLTSLMLLLVMRVGAFARDDNSMIKRTSQILGPLPATMASEQNPITPEKVKLGKILFYEQRISVDGTVSCSKCHTIALYAADGLKKSVGHNRFAI